MYLHAFQSEVWNFVASFRAQRYGLSHAVAGDLIYVHEDEGGREGRKEGQERSYEKEVRLVTEEEGREGSVPITRVVLPMPGVNVTYPLNECGGQYKLRCEARGVGLEAFRNKAQSEYTLGGDYRKVVERPEDFEWKVRVYDRERSERLVESDVDVLVRKEEEEGKEGGRDGLPVYWKRFAKELRREKEGEGEGAGEEGSRALVVSFTLPPSTYATMLLRELLKVSMTTQEMKKLNDTPSLSSAKPVPREEKEEGGKEEEREEGEAAWVMVEGRGEEEHAQEA
eukprot:evm.model.NODE_20879_length_20762_cov_47.043877.5